MSEAKLEGYFFTALFIGVFVLVGSLFYPFVGALAVALVLAILVEPLYDFIVARTHKEMLSALFVVLLTTLAILLPAIGLFMLLLEELAAIAHSATYVNYGAMPRFLADLQQTLESAFPMLANIDYSSVLNDALRRTADAAAAAVTGTLSAVFKLFVALIALYYFVKDGHRFVASLITLSPLADDEDEQIVQRIKVVTHSLIRGTMVVALLQGGMVGIGFALFDVPNPILWGSVAAIGALVPTIGTGIVTIPAVLWLAFSGQWAAAIGLAAWGVFIVGYIDNLIGPKIIGTGSHIHPLFILLSVLGGLAAFGVAGFLLGPLIFGVLVSLLEIYKAKVRKLHTDATA